MSMLEYADGNDRVIVFEYMGIEYRLLISGLAKGTIFTMKKVWYKKKPIKKEVDIKLPEEVKEYLYTNNRETIINYPQ